MAESNEQEGGGGAKVYVWGTRICVSDVQKSFKLFLHQYRPAQFAEDDNMLITASDGALEPADPRQPHYMQHIDEVSAVP